MLQRDVPFLLKQMPRRSQKVLELCVGTGRVAIPLAQAGHRVTGVDYAAELLAIARRKRAAVGLMDRQITLVHADVRRLSLGEKFDWICILFNTLLAFPSLSELDQVLQTVRGHLKPRGRFWLDIFQPDMSLLSGAQTRGFEPRVFHVPALDRTVYCETEIRRQIARQLQEVTFHYTWFDARGTRRGERVSFEMTWLFPRELELLLDRNGFSIERVWGNHDGKPLSDDSPRIIAKARLKR